MAKKPNKEGALRRAYEGIDTVYHPNVDIYNYNAGKLMQGVNQGWGKVSFNYNSPDFKLYESISDNIYLFSGAKTFQQTLDMSHELIKGGKLVTFEEFKKSAGKIFDDYNVSWLDSEYRTAIQSASNAKQWNKIQEEKKTFPYLKWMTSGDETVCRICGPMDGITLPVGSSFFKGHYPPLHFGCHCKIQQLDRESMSEGEKVTTDKKLEAKKAQVKPYLDKTFKNNSGITGQIYSTNHPYFRVPKEYRKLAQNNFGLPIPLQHPLK